MLLTMTAAQVPERAKRERTSPWGAAPPPPPPPSTPAPPPQTDDAIDAITRAIKSGMDVDTLKAYIDEVARTVGNKAGSWIEPALSVEEENRRTQGRGADAVTGSTGAPLQYGPVPPGRSDWDCKEDIRAEREAAEVEVKVEAAARAARASLAAKAAESSAETKSEPLRVAASAESASLSGPDIRGETLSTLSGRIANDDVRLRPGSAAVRIDPYLRSDYIPTGEVIDGPQAKASSFSVPYSVPLFDDEEDQEMFNMAMDAANAAEDSDDEAVRGIHSAADLPDDYVAWDAEPEQAWPDSPQQVSWGEEELESEESVASTVTRAQLEDLAKKHGLDLAKLLADAASKGISIE